MRKITQLRRPSGAMFAVAAALAVILAVPPAIAKHPRLVKVESTTCATCHGKLIRGKSVVHAPVLEDCAKCHQVDVGDEGTAIGLVAEGPGLCVTCHDRLEKAASGEVAAPHAPVADSCLVCHVPHAGDHPSLLVEAVPGLCSTCHEISDLQDGHGGQLTEQVDCASCHEPHGDANRHLLAGANQHAPFEDATCDACHRDPFAGRIRLRARGEKVCSACHGDPREPAGDQGSVHVALEGTRVRAGCMNCHDPHMSSYAGLLRKSGTTLCRSCHDTVVEAANAATGHPPAAEDCTICHRPHASEHRRLLVDDSPDLCLMCHDADDAELAAAHLGAQMGTLECTTCHSAHGTGNPHLLAEHVHPVIADGCATCHQGSAAQLVDDGASSLCLICHEDIGEAAEAAAVHHAVMEMAPCATCHNPHASAQKKLVRGADGGACTACHDDMAAGDDEFAHGVIALVGCRACHEPHGGDGEKLLRLQGDELCLECHDSRRVTVPQGSTEVLLLGRFAVSARIGRAAASLALSSDGEHGHPLPRHRVLGTPTAEEIARTDTTFTGELHCLSCHDPHKSRSTQLFKQASSQVELCGECHEK